MEPSSLATDAETTPETERRWRAVLVLEGVKTDDGRLIDPGALDWRDLPLTLMGMTTTGPGGHQGAEVAGRIDTIERIGNEIIGEGPFDSGDFGAEIYRMVGDETLRGVSVDLAIREFELRGQDGMALEEGAAEEPIFAVTDASIMGATVCPFPAFADANIVLVADGENPPSRATWEFGTIELALEPGQEEVLIEAEGENAIEAGSLVDDLRVLTANASTMGSNARGYHWTVQGSSFSQESALFEAIYKDVSASVDEYASAIRVLGGNPPSGLEEIVDLRQFPDAGEAVAAFDMNVALRSQNEKMLAALNRAFAVAVAAEEPGIAQMLSGRIERHQRWAWQLKVALAV